MGEQEVGDGTGLAGDAVAVVVKGDGFDEDRRFIKPGDDETGSPDTVASL